MTEDEMVGWHHQFDGHESEQALGVGDAQGSLVCCSQGSERVRHDWTTELNWTWPLPTLEENEWQPDKWIWEKEVDKNRCLWVLFLALADCRKQIFSCALHHVVSGLFAKTTSFYRGKSIQFRRKYSKSSRLQVKSYIFQSSLSVMNTVFLSPMPQFLPNSEKEEMYYLWGPLNTKLNTCDFHL